MFSKNRRPASLALRLSAWYAGSAFLLLLGGTGFLYWEGLAFHELDAAADEYYLEDVNESPWISRPHAS